MSSDEPLKYARIEYPKPTWKVNMFNGCITFDVMDGVKCPSRFQRLMLRWLLDIRWERIDECQTGARDEQSESI